MTLEFKRPRREEQGRHKDHLKLTFGTSKLALILSMMPSIRGDAQNLSTYCEQVIAKLNRDLSCRRRGVTARVVQPSSLVRCVVGNCLRTKPVVLARS